jgi:hypothetical protein
LPIVGGVAVAFGDCVAPGFAGGLFVTGRLPLGLVTFGVFEELDNGAGASLFPQPPIAIIEMSMKQRKSPQFC